MTSDNHWSRICCVLFLAVFSGIANCTVPSSYLCGN